MKSAAGRLPLAFFLGALLLALVVMLKMIAPYVIALIMGSILAMIAMPVKRRLMARGMKPAFAGMTVTIGVVLLIVAPFLTFTTLAVKQAIKFGTIISEGHFSAQEVLDKATKVLPLDTLGIDQAELVEYLRTAVQAIGKTASATVLAIAKSLPDGILQLLLACMACYFFLVDGKAFLRWLVPKIPLDPEVRQKLAGSFKDTAISVVWASMAAALTQGAIMSITFMILRVPAAFLAGGATFVFAWIPLVGSVPVWIGGAIYLYMQGEMGKMVAMIVLGLLTGIVDNFVRPLVLRGRGEMHPLVSLVAIFGGLEMFGLFGVFLGPIIAAVVITMMQVWPQFAQRYGLDVGGNEPS